MPINSVITNIGAMVALQSLNKTADQLTATQKRISTGYRVADAKDDGAAFAVAERIRGDMAAVSSANQQLGGMQGLLSVTSTALQNVNGTLQKLKEVVVKLADGNISTDQRSQYWAQVTQLTKNIKNFIDDASYNGVNVLNVNTAASVNVVATGDGKYYSFSSFTAVAQIYDVVSGATAYGATQAVSALSATGAVTKAIDRTLTQLNNFGSYANYIEAQINYNKAIMDAQSAGLGALVDADMAKESAQLQALQIRQQLGTQALGIANQAPQVLLSLFR